MKLIWKMSLLVICEILRLFVNIVDADDKCSLLSSENLPQPFQTQLSNKYSFFSQFFVAFLQFSSNFDYFENQGIPHSLCISEIRNCERRG